ncbi:MAG: hypothetical protein AB7Q17_17660 [Phycisphaerae bacterium]
MSAPRRTASTAVADTAPGAPAGDARTTCRAAGIASWIAQVCVAGILAQTLYFKFTGAPESTHIFRTLGLEPWGRFATGVAELIAVVLLLTPRTVALGAGLALGVIAGALVGHLTRLGIAVQNDGGQLFGLALLVFAGSVLILMIRRHQLRAFGGRLVAAVRASRDEGLVAADSRKSDSRCPPLEATR